jgi:hypothetical protein
LRGLVQGIHLQQLGTRSTVEHPCTKPFDLINKFKEIFQ